MSLISIVATLAVLGFILYLVLTYIPMPEPIKKVIIVVVVIALCVWLLQLTGFGNISLGRIGN